METNKYYTPSIEEFHVGFELEIKTHELRPWEKHTWLPGDQAKSVSNYLDQIRVKCLDSEDLIELGFEEIGQEEYYLNGDLNSWCIEALYHQSIKSYYRIDDGETQRMFLEIKNKSELKRILKMIGAIE